MKTRVFHAVNHGTGQCLGLKVWLWCPGCEELHSPTFRCPEHNGPDTGPTWDGDPNSDPFSMEPSLLVQGKGVCHSFIRNGKWEFLSDSTHSLAGHTVEMVDLPGYVQGENWKGWK